MRAPPSSSAADDDDDDYAFSSPDHHAEISDSDLDKNEAEVEEIEKKEEDGNGNDDVVDDATEEEYVEIEVEEEEVIIEEIEVEEEEEEEEGEGEGGGEEEGEGGGEEEGEEAKALDSSKEVNQKSNVVCQFADFEGDHSQSPCSTPGRPEPRLPCNSLVEDSIDDSKSSSPPYEQLMVQGESYVNRKESGYLKPGAHIQDFGAENDRDPFMLKNGSGEHSHAHIDGKASLCNGDFMAAETTHSISILKNEVYEALVVNDGSKIEANGILDASEEAKAMQSRDDKQQTTSRTQSLSPSSTFADLKKRPAVICDFFAKGWCIRGGSCSFLHVNDKNEDAKEQLEGDPGATNSSNGNQFNEGSSMGKDTAFSFNFSSERILALQNGEIQRLHQLDDRHASSSLKRRVHSVTQKFPSSKDDLKFSFSFKDAATENHRKFEYGSYASPINSGSSPSFFSSLVPQHRSSSCSAVTSSNSHSGNPSSFSSNMENSMYVRGRYMPASGLDGSLSSNDMLPFHQISGRLFSFSSSLNRSPLGQKMLDNGRAYHTSRSSSLLQSASPLSGSERESLPLASVSGNPLCYAKHKAKVSSDDWEPSIPFRPSFFVTPTLASPHGGPYDPLRSIDLPSTRYRLPFKFSSFSQDTSSLNMSQQPTYNNSLASQSLDPECNDGKHNGFLHSRFTESVVDNNHCTPGKDIFGTGALTRGSCVDGKNWNMPKEDNASNTSHIRDVPNTSKIDADCDSRNENDGAKCKKKLKVDRGRQNSEMEVEQKTDGESRIVRHFRAALIDFVKELIKPTWREGHISKEAHNTIVKKAVDKVLSTLQPHQIPTNIESTKQYLSFSQPKIAKLVEGYCTKYGKH